MEQVEDKKLDDNKEPSSDYDCDHVWHEHICGFCGRTKEELGIK